MVYKLDKNKEKKLRLFGKSFVQRNKLNCKMIYNNRIYEINEFFEDINKDYEDKDCLSIKLRINSNIINAKLMFEGCNSLLSLSNINPSNKKIKNSNPIKLK